MGNARIGENRHRGRAGILINPDDLDNVAFRRHEREPVQGQVHLDDLDCLFPRHRFGDEDVHLALDVVVHHQLLAREIFVKVQDVEHVAVWVLHCHHVDGPVRQAGPAGGTERDKRRRPGHLPKSGHGKKKRRGEAEEEAAQHALM